MMPKTGWDPPYAILAVLIFVLLLTLAAEMASADSKVFSDLGSNLISELLGFALTFWMVESLLGRQDRHSKETLAARRRVVVEHQSVTAWDRVDLVLIGQSSFGPQYSPELQKALSALNRLDFDCAELLSAELSSEMALGINEFHRVTRELIAGLEVVQGGLWDKASHGSPLPKQVLDGVSNWKQIALAALGADFRDGHTAA